MAPAADATYPGRNGRIAYTVVQGPSPHTAFSTETVLPNGRGRRRLGEFALLSWAASGRLLLGTTLTWTDGLAVRRSVLADDQGQVLHTIPVPPGPDGGPVFSPTALSPDGRTVAGVSFVVRPHAQPEQVVDWIWTMRTDGTQLRRVARGTRPRWTPNGRRIVFQRESRFGDYTGIASTRSDGRFKRLLIGGADARFLDLAPDGRRLLWYDSRRAGRLVTSDLRGGHRRLIFRRATQGAATWSPDGTKILFAIDDYDLQGTFIASATGASRQRLLRRPRFELAWQPLPRTPG